MKSINVNKPNLSKLSTLDFAVKSGADSILISDNLCKLDIFSNMVKASSNVLMEIEQIEDTISKYFELAK